jgi:hypothetical protein
MNRRSITLGVSIIALALAGPGKAEADVLGGAAGTLPDTNVSVDVQANTGVKANADLGAPRLPKRSHTDSGTNTSVKVKSDTKSARSGVGTGLNAQAETGKGPLDAHAGLEQGARLRGAAHGRSVAGSLATGGKGGLTLDTRRHHRAAGLKAKGDARMKAHSPVSPSVQPPASGTKKGGLPLRGVGREVGNPIQLSLAGWLIALTAAATCLGASRLVRRLQRTRL